MSSAAVWGTSINIVAIGFFAGFIGYLINFIIIQSNRFALSASTLTTMNYISLGFYVFAFNCFIALIFHHIIVSLNEQTRAV